MNSGVEFHKMSGSGNDFVFLAANDPASAALENGVAIAALCARATGVGADGVVFLAPGTRDSFVIRYYNSDGSRGELCGNATLCSLKLALEIGMIDAGEISIETDSATVKARMVDGVPEFDLAPMSEVSLSFEQVPRLERESALGFARAGVPHIVIVDRDVESADILRRGSAIRRDPALRDGANVNFVERAGSEWIIRTYERGVEGETLACGTGAVATAILLGEWGLAGSPVRLRTRSGRSLEVRVAKEEGRWFPSLRGNAELVFTGRLRDFGPF